MPASQFFDAPAGPRIRAKAAIQIMRPSISVKTPSQPTASVTVGTAFSVSTHTSSVLT